MASASAPQKAAAPAGGRDNMPWVEKYRPSLVRDIVGNAEAVSRLEIIAADGNMPNMIFAGPPGTGKTTSVLCLANALLGSAAKEAVLELNASDDRGIDVVRNKIKMFAQKKVTLPPGRHKIVILDEADSMTTGAQQALRRTMEIYSQTTRFALACNLSTKIIEPIQSRCAVIRFTKLSDAEVLERLKFVVQEENVPHVDEGLEAIIFSADGDMRQALNNVQATHSGFSFVNAANVCDQPHPTTVRKCVQACMDGDADTAFHALHSLWAQGYSALDLVGTLFRVVKNFDMPEFYKLEYIREVGACHVRVAEGCDTLLQLSGLLARLARNTVRHRWKGGSFASARRSSPHLHRYQSTLCGTR
eukprot:PRCOL_00002254-RA